MYLEPIPEKYFTTTLIKLKYDCCGKEHVLKMKDAQKNFEKNNQQHICRSCWLRLNNPAHRVEVQDKIKKTCIERYGSECILNTKKNINARNESIFGSEENLKRMLDRRRKTCIEKYGVDHAMKSEESKKKLREVFQKKYGADTPLQNKEVAAKMKQTNLERYGVENVAQVPEIRLKMAQTTFEKYGVEHYNQLPEMRSYLQDNCREWLKESYEHPWAKGIVRPEEWNEKQSETMANKITSGELEPCNPKFYITGYFYSNKCKKKRAFFRSGLELMTHYYLHINEDVNWYENEPFSIKYETKKGIRRYIPDFFVNRIKQSPMLLEIKPAFRMREEATQYKVISATQYAKEHEWKFIYIDETFFKEQGIYIQDIKNLDFVELNK